MPLPHRYPAGVLSVKGVDFQLFTDDSGNWITYPDPDGGEPVYGASRDELKTNLVKQIRAARTSVAVPFFILAQDKVRAGTATGIHGQSRNVLVTWTDDGSKEQLRHLGGGTKVMAGDIDPAEWQRIRDAYITASKALYAYEEAHGLQLYAVVRAALTAAVARDPA